MKEPASRTAPPAIAPVAPTGCRALLLGEISNFADIRRLIGRSAAEELMLEMLAQVAALAPTASVGLIGRAALEIDVADYKLACLKELVIRCRQHLSDLVPGMTVRLRFGGAVAPVDAADEVTLAEAAEVALAQAQDEERDVLRDLQSATDDPAMLVATLPQALADGHIFLNYQPKIHLRRQQVVGAEALVRWRHPQRGLIMPGDFIEAAERRGEIGRLTLWTLERMIADQRFLSQAGHDFPLFLNISGVLLGDREFADKASAILHDGGARIGFEITETAVIRDPEAAIGNLKRFAALGVPLAIDDYGAGLSSLAYLRRLPASELKIDKMFVTQLTSSNRDPLIVRSTIDLAHALDMEVTAEGVETPAALALLGVMGCDMVQGFLISRPTELGALVQFLDGDAFRSRADVKPITFRRATPLWKAG